VKFPVGYTVRFSDDGALLACLGRNVVVIDVSARRRLSTSHPLSHPSDVAFSPDGATLVIKNTSGRIVIIDPRSGEVLRDHRNQKEGPGDEVQFSPDGDQLVDSSWSGELTVRQALDGSIHSREQFPGEMITRLTHDETRLNWLIEHQPIVRPGENFAPPAYVELRKWPFMPGNANMSFGFDIDNATLSPDGRSICLIEKPAFRLHVAHVSTGALVASGDTFAHGGTGNEIAWSTDGRLIASVQARKFVFYRSSDLTILGEVSCEYPSSMSFRAGGQQVALGSWKKSAILPLSAVWQGGLTLK
jgi:WD40 repeat protein